ncbi:exonuclease V [Xylariaceae sp. FL0016]|nr:exonuclease V [Xylariaceae sp. FL0016]
MASDIASSTVDDSDYASDFSIGEEAIVNRLLDNVANEPILSTVSNVPSKDNSQRDAIETVASNSRASTPLRPIPRDISQLPSSHTLSSGAKTRAGLRGRSQYDFALHSLDPNAHTWTSDVQYPDLSRSLFTIDPRPTPSNSVHANADDLRSPLERFRTFPKKPLTVTDLSSGAWCELQHWYTLTLLPGGRKTKTAAMRGGSKVHQTLEDQVHTNVHVQITSKEEAFALRIWNVIQGLRTLRDTGMTREFEVWGTIDGQVINGIIDHLSYESPNAGFEKEPQLADPNIVSSVSQTSIKNYLLPSCSKVYLTDVKTRGSDRLPTGAALRPARVQLFLYHRLLGNMASGNVDYVAIQERYGLENHARFSDAFMAQIGGLHDEVFYDADSELGEISSAPEQHASGHPYPDASPDLPSRVSPPPDLIRYRSLEQLLRLFGSELENTFPHGAASLGDLLAVQYRHRDDGRIIGNNVFPNDPEALDGYMKRNLKWWRGERQADGVPIEEAYKCRSCEFAGDCQWRKDKQVEFLQRKRGASKVADSFEAG